MEKLYADIIINISHEALDKVFAYKVPFSMIKDIRVGQQVVVPFGRSNKEQTGYVGGIGIFLYMLLLFIEALLDHRRMSFEKLAATAFCSFIIPYMFSALVRIGITSDGRFYI